MKICHVITRMIVGGAQENTLLSIRGALEKGHDVTLVTGPSEGPEGELLKKVPCPGMKLIECPDLVREISPLRDLRAYFFLKKLFRKEKFDVVHTHSSKAGIVGRFAGDAAKVPLVVHTIHGLAFHRFEKKWKNALYIACEKLAAGHSSRIYAVAQAMIDQSLQAGIGKKEDYKVVYSGMVLENFLNAVPSPELRQKLGIPGKAVVFATLARLFPLKGYEDFFPAAIELAKESAQVHFLIIGDGLLTDHFKKMIASCGMEKRFSFAGLVPPDEVCNYLALSDALVHLSLREGLPRAAVQSLASGHPVIACNLDGTPEVVKNGETGFLLEPGDRKGVLDAMRFVISHPEEAARLGGNGKKLVSGLFDWHTMADTLLEDYEKTLSGKGLNHGAL